MTKTLKWIGIVIGALVMLLLLAVAALYPAGYQRFSRRYPDLKVEAVRVPAGADAIAHGKHISIIWGCTRCHGSDLSGTLLTNDPLLGTIPASNLTPGQGGIGSAYADMDWIRAVRHGVSPDGVVLALMPDYSAMSDHDLGDLIAYLAQLPPVDKQYPALNLGPVIPLAPALGLYTPAAEVIDHTAARPVDPVAGASIEYGEYLFAICRECHSVKLARDLMAWTKEDFVRALRTGMFPNGRTLAAAMRSPSFAEFDDTELAALWTYLAQFK